MIRINLIKEEKKGFSLNLKGAFSSVSFDKEGLLNVAPFLAGGAVSLIIVGEAIYGLNVKGQISSIQQEINDLKVTRNKLKPKVAKIEQERKRLTDKLSKLKAELNNISRMEDTLKAFRSYSRIFLSTMNDSMYGLPKKVWLKEYHQSLSNDSVRVFLSARSYDRRSIRKVIKSLGEEYSLVMPTASTSSINRGRNRDSKSPIKYKEKLNRYGMPIYEVDLSLGKKLTLGEG